MLILQINKSPTTLGYLVIFVHSSMVKHCQSVNLGQHLQTLVIAEVVTNYQFGSGRLTTRFYNRWCRNDAAVDDVRQ